MWALVMCMVAIGGITRLTGSGLSMVDWHPLMGAVPPVSEEAWLDVFKRYQQSPQYLTVNHWMALSDFKRIFFWEYLHRMFGRLLGVAFVVPLVYFVARRRLRGAWLAKALVALVLGGGQGLLGWYMVMSGLLDEPRVSHLRLAAHLGLAFSVGAYLLWLALDLRAPPVVRASGRVRAAGWALLAGLALQVVFGAFMAGTGAGRLSNTFPDLNGGYLPGPFFRLGGLWENLTQSPLAIHWTHRALAWVVLVLGLALAWVVLRGGAAGWGRAARALVLVLIAQITLGAMTVVYGVPLGLAVVHQVCGYLVWSCGVWLVHRLHGRGAGQTA